MVSTYKIDRETTLSTSERSKIGIIYDDNFNPIEDLGWEWGPFEVTISDFSKTLKDHRKHTGDVRHLNFSQIEKLESL